MYPWVSDVGDLGLAEGRCIFHRAGGCCFDSLLQRHHLHITLKIHLLLEKSSEASKEGCGGRAPEKDRKPPLPQFFHDFTVRSLLFSDLILFFFFIGVEDMINEGFC